MGPCIGPRKMRAFEHSSRFYAARGLARSHPQVSANTLFAMLSQRTGGEMVAIFNALGHLRHQTSRRTLKGV
jgi:hypothetical protein